MKAIYIFLKFKSVAQEEQFNNEYSEQGVAILIIAPYFLQNINSPFHHKSVYQQ